MIDLESHPGNVWGSSDAGSLGNTEHPCITIAPRSILARIGILQLVAW